MRRIRRVAVLLVLALLVALQVPAAAQPGGTAEFKAFLVGLRPGVAAAALAGPDVRVAHEWPHLDAAAVRATPAGVARLAAHRGVEYVEEDRAVYATAINYSPGELTWGLKAVKAPDAWSLGAEGSGIRVCVLDTGIDFNHPEFRDSNNNLIIKDSASFIDGEAVQDGHGHGTHVAGTIAAQDSGTGVVGVAPRVHLYIAKVLSNSGSGSSSTVINGLNWCVSRGAHVASLSLGSSVGSRTEQRAFDDAYARGTLSVAASGNDGKERIGYPAKYPSVVAVGAVDVGLNLAGFSNYGSEQELVGPGVNVLSTVPLGTGLLGSAAENSASYEANPLEYAPSGTVSGPYVECGLADSTSSCTNVPSAGGWIAMIDRGSIAFADKVRNVMAQGAAAAVIANNDTASPDDFGNFTLGSAGDWIPTVSVSYNGGAAIRADGLQSGTVSIGSADYAYYSGTSMATPHVSAVAALTWSANGALKNTDVRKILQESAQDLGAAGWDKYYGYGLARADLAVQKARGSGGGGSNGTMKVAVEAGGPYQAGDFVYVRVTVTDAGNGSALGGAGVALRIHYPDGSPAASGSAATGSDGTVTFRWKSNRNGPKGTHKAVADVTLSGYDPASGDDTFDVN